MKKSDRIEAEVGGPYQGELAGHPCYTGWFEHFNAGRYYEAHDVLEHLWLQTTGPEYEFFKGLIQLAGAFVHLKKHYEHPGHLKHGRRLRPAVRLFALAEKNLVRYPTPYLELHVGAVVSLCHRWMLEIERHHYSVNPWAPRHGPILHLARA